MANNIARDFIKGKTFVYIKNKEQYRKLYDLNGKETMFDFEEKGEGFCYVFAGNSFGYVEYDIPSKYGSIERKRAYLIERKFLKEVKYKDLIKALKEND